MNLPALCHRMNSFGYSMLERGIFLDSKTHKLSQTGKFSFDLTWSGQQSSFFNMPFTTKDYLVLLECGSYSFLLYDGSLLQLSYRFEKGLICGHRLLYAPCPIEFDSVLLKKFLDTTGDTVYDFICDRLATETTERSMARSPLRFDFAKDELRDGHPFSHLTLNDSCCRIPMKAPLGFDGFMKIVLENFYPDIWLGEGLSSELHNDRQEQCLTTDDKKRHHVYW